MREIRLSGSEGGGAETNRPSLPLFFTASLRDAKWPKYRSGHKPWAAAIPPLGVKTAHLFSLSAASNRAIAAVALSWRKTSVIWFVY